MAGDFYGDAAGLQTYLEQRGRDLPGTVDDEAIEAALLVASEWIDAAFAADFCGLKTGAREQVREWPRVGVVDRYGYAIGQDEIPRELLSATYEAAYRQILTPGIFFKDYTPGKYKSVAISGAVSVVYATGSAYDFQTQMPAIAAILSPLFGGCGSSGLSSLSGAITR